MATTPRDVRVGDGPCSGRRSRRRSPPSAAGAGGSRPRSRLPRLGQVAQGDSAAEPTGGAKPRARAPARSAAERRSRLSLPRRHTSPHQSRRNRHRPQPHPRSRLPLLQLERPAQRQLQPLARLPDPLHGGQEPHRRAHRIHAPRRPARSSVAEPLSALRSSSGLNNSTLPQRLQHPAWVGALRPLPLSARRHGHIARATL